MIGKYNKIIIVAEGLENWALTVMGNRFAATISREDNREMEVSFEPYFGRRVSETEMLQWVQKLDCILILTDIINTGITVTKVIERIMSVINDYRLLGYDLKIPDIKIFAVATMSNSKRKTNSPHEYSIEAAVEIMRPYYEKNEVKCPLCLLGQPPISIKDVKGFSEIDDSQPTPFDFWEVIEDCKALVMKQDYPAGGQLLFRVDTKRILERYSKWLSKVIVKKYGVAFGNIFPGSIITIDEEGGREFTSLVVRALNLYHAPVVRIGRAELNDRDKFSTKVNKEIALANQPLLLIDDGINKGDTIRRLIERCISEKFQILGAMVLDNRLDETELHKIENKMRGKRVLALYTWKNRAI